VDLPGCEPAQPAKTTHQTTRARLFAVVFALVPAPAEHFQSSTVGVTTYRALSQRAKKAWIAIAASCTSQSYASRSRRIHKLAVFVDARRSTSSLAPKNQVKPMRAVGANSTRKSASLRARSKSCARAPDPNTCKRLVRRPLDGRRVSEHQGGVRRVVQHPHGHVRHVECISDVHRVVQQYGRAVVAHHFDTQTAEPVAPGRIVRRRAHRAR